MKLFDIYDKFIIISNQRVEIICPQDGEFYYIGDLNYIYKYKRDLLKCDVMFVKLNPDRILVFLEHNY